MAKSSGPAIVNFDGGCHHNPGPAAGAAVLKLPDGRVVTATKFLPHATNNEAEYAGLIAGLEKALELGFKEIQVFGDSELIIKQVKGQYRCKQPHLVPLRDQAVQLAQQFQSFSLNWVPRAQNAEADAAAGIAIQSASKTRPLPVTSPAQSAPAPKPPETLQERVDKLNEKGPGAGFKEFSSLKVPGSRDEYSSMRYPKLREQTPEDVQRTIADALENDEQLVTKALRWYLRGLLPAVAVRKVQVDLEVNAKMAKSASKR
ncbi:MAG: ribonuclease HI family protein [Leptolyngbyaceae cyanobacterium bins.59]|nr:ribonuclease HI family protein [Leptolyngbyaceae cyanobacterium bins.59]